MKSWFDPLWLFTVVFLMLMGFGAKPASGSRTVSVPLKVVTGRGWSIYNHPFDSRSRVVLNTRSVDHQLVQIKKRVSRHGRTELLIQHQGRTYGWVDSRALVVPKEYVLPYHYYSQLFPLWAPEACEATSLKIALSVKGLDRGYGLQYIINHMPKSSNSNRGFSGDPYRDNSGFFYWWNLIRHGFNAIFGQTIYPKPLAKYARRYDPAARNVTGASKLKLINEIKHGNSVVFVGAFQMLRHTSSYHVLALVGYRRGYFLVADPYRTWRQHHRVFWVPTRRFMLIFNSQLRHRRAVAI